MSFNYAKAAATARRLLAKFGQSMMLTSQTTTYNELTAETTTTTSTATDKGVIFPDSNGIQSLAGSIIQSGDMQVYINIATAPQPNDTLTVGSVVYQVVNVKPLEPSGVNVLYELQVRR